MDLLSQRYANPYFFMDGMIKTGRFCEFVVDLINTTNEEKNDKTMWEIFLHKVWDKSFAEFKEEIENDTNNQNMTEETVETTVQESLNILQNFNPNE